MIKAATLTLHVVQCTMPTIVMFIMIERLPNSQAEVATAITTNKGCLIVDGHASKKSVLIMIESRKLTLVQFTLSLPSMLRFATQVLLPVW